MKRKVLVILSNRLAPLRKARYFEIVCKSDGTVLAERRLEAAPKKAVYDEVWENSDGKTELDTCTRMSRHYKHKLLKPRRGSA
jgi:hypothetical protein